MGAKAAQRQPFCGQFLKAATHRAALARVAEITIEAITRFQNHGLTASSARLFSTAKLLGLSRTNVQNASKLQTDDWAGVL